MYQQSYPVLSASDAFMHQAIWAPKPVGVQPWYAHRDLCVLRDGEIRHYGWEIIAGEPRRVFVSSRDWGLSWKKIVVFNDDELGAMVQSPYSGDFLTICSVDKQSLALPSLHSAGQRGTALIRSAQGPGSTEKSVEFLDCPGFCFFRQPLPLRHRQRWLCVGATVNQNGAQWATALLSDDDGKTWRRRVIEPNVSCDQLIYPDRGLRWNNYCCEPTIVELADGTLLMAVRTSFNCHYLYRSEDGGDSWSGPDPMPHFHATNTMPTFLRLQDGRILFFWNNAQALPKDDPNTMPELNDGERQGRWETVFTNRDVIHAAISDDDGKSWRGFRELYLNSVRNQVDFRTLGNDELHEHDKSVHQSQALELPNGKVLIALGQNPAARRLLLFDPGWLYETERHEDFRHGLGDLSTHLYVKSLTGNSRGWAGHCAWNRCPGAMLVREPDNPKGSREVLHLARIHDERLYSDRQGVVWNFPAARQGQLSIEIFIAGAGCNLTLSDCWFNPCDPYAAELSPFSCAIDAARIGANTWKTLHVTWNLDARNITLSCDDQIIANATITNPPQFGLSYLHLQTLATTHDPQGCYLKSLHKA